MLKKNNHYLRLKNQAESVDDLAAQLLFRLTEEIMAARLENRQAVMADSRWKERLSQDQAELVDRIIFSFRKIIAEKKIDLSEIVSGTDEIAQQLESSKKTLEEGFQLLLEEFPETREEIARLGQILRQWTSQEKFLTEIIQTEKITANALSKLLAALIEEVKNNKPPRKMEIASPIEVIKPKWYAPFEFSWEKLKVLLENLKKHTFLVKVENPLNINELPKETAKRLAQELEKILPALRGGGGMGNPFNFDEIGNLKTTSQGDETYKFKAEYNAQHNPLYIGYAEPKTLTSEAAWQIRKFIYNGEDLIGIDWADGDRKFDNIWDNRSGLNYS